MELYQLRYLCAVARRGSFTAAARDECVSVQAVSAGIRKLEAELGTAVFERGGLRVILTTDGERLLRSATRLVDEMAEMERQFGEKRGPEFTIGTLWGLGAQRVHQLVGTLSDAVQTRIDIRVYGWDDPTGGLRTGDVDLSIIPGPTEIDGVLERVPLWSEPRVAILPTEVATEVGREVTLAELDAIGWVRFPRPDPVGHRYWRLDDIRGGAPRERGPVWRSPQEIILAVAQGRGTCTTLASFREQFSFYNVELVRIADVPWVSVDLARPRDHTNRVAAEFFDSLAKIA